MHKTDRSASSALSSSASATEAAMDDAKQEEPWVLSVTARAPSNIAVIKYWGKRDEKLVLPLNSSLSVTLNPADLSATTTAAASPAYEADRLWLNGKEVPLESARYQAIFAQMRARARGARLPGPAGRMLSGEELAAAKLHIVSENNFPTAAGLASSAAGFACLVYSLAKLLNVAESYPGELTALARQGSGSACRSLFGGFVRWNAGVEEDGRDSIAQQVAPAAHWPDLRILIAVVSSKQKETSSTAGMQDSVRTSALIHHRAAEVVPGRVLEIEAAIRARDFGAFARLTCADSNQFHAICLDTAPPIFYLTDTSRKLISLVERWNGASSIIKAAYTFDAGPNAVLFTTLAFAPSLLRRLLYHFPPPPGVLLSSYVVGDQSVQHDADIADAEVSGLPPPAEAVDFQRFAGELQYIISTRPGEGAHYLEDTKVQISQRGAEPADQQQGGQQPDEEMNIRDVENRELNLRNRMLSRIRGGGTEDWRSMSLSDQDGMADTFFLHDSHSRMDFEHARDCRRIMFDDLLSFERDPEDMDQYWDLIDSIGYQSVGMFLLQSREFSPGDIGRILVENSDAVTIAIREAKMALGVLVWLGMSDLPAPS